MQRILHDMNPAVKLAAVTGSVLVLALFFNPWTPLFFFIGTLMIQACFSRISWKRYVFFMLPFVITAAGYLWTTVVFAAETEGPVIWSWAGFDVTAEQWSRALSLAFRVLAFSSVSLLFAFTTDPVKFALSLMQQLKLSPKLAYSMLVGYQFLPLLREEFTHIRQAQRLRGAGTETGLLHRVRNIRRVLLPMLSGAVRKAERTAFAMEARGFTGEPRTVFFEPVPLTRIDAAMGMLFAALLLLSSICGVALA
ncbi:energy-coupling factor transporter transmembrane component T family protein [Indiicoccus explosivorum]|uniref:energy-coupling factor transporter transmembrane component T family protein n=1 Tax=Indiicoccus explosivorum TaxID=1917864 RepID=UPI000B441E8E|nr:energy-coupling factor transporter transmembrane component T [Indiicoccus explosivorum]